MSIITYPLNGVTYDAEDVSTYLCTRTSGVYAKDTNYAVSVTGPRQITVAPGLAWINYDDFKGVSACSREAVNLTVPDADSTLPRIDRVVLQFDTAANLTAVKLKPGTPAAAPEPPAILQNHNQYELGLCTVSVPAGSSVVTAADITDTRAAEDVCGVMRDGVTGIPTAQLQAQALDIAPDGTLSAKTLNDKIAAAVAVKSEPRLVWNTHATSPNKFTTWDVQIPGNVDKICITKGRSSSSGNNTEKSIARGGTTTYDCNYDFTITFQTNGILHVANSYKTLYPLELWIDGYHYPTLADLLTETQAAQADTDALAVDADYRLTLLELGLDE